MAGMLPGVECARRRRFHQGGWIDPQNLIGHGSTRRSSFCLYTSNHETHLNSNSSLNQPRKTLNHSFQFNQLEGAAKEAKDRLDERLGTKRKSDPKRHSNKGTIKSENGKASYSSILGVQTEVFGSKRSGSKRFSWAKFGWKASEQDECAVCLDAFKTGEILVHLPCAHRFHSRCLVPWLESSAHCPCCRTKILT